MNINVKTAFLWRHKIIETVEDFEEGMILSGTIWIDEYQMSSNSKGRKFEFSRPRRHHGNDPVDSINDDCVTILLAIMIMTIYLSNSLIMVKTLHLN